MKGQRMKGQRMKGPRTNARPPAERLRAERLRAERLRAGRPVDARRREPFAVFLRGLGAGALVGAAIAGSRIWRWLRERGTSR